MVLLVGLRQTGKTWLAREIAKKFSHSVYLNYDQVSDREIIVSQSWLDNTELVILDELHKIPDWKNDLNLSIGAVRILLFCLHVIAIVV